MTELYAALSRADVLTELAWLDLLVTYPVDVDVWANSAVNIARVLREECNLKNALDRRVQGTLKHLGLRSIPACDDGIALPSVGFLNRLWVSGYDITMYKY